MILGVLNYWSTPSHLIIFGEYLGTETCLELSENDFDGYQLLNNPFPIHCCLTVLEKFGGRDIFQTIREDVILILDDFILRVPNYIPTFAILCVENIREQATWT